ncbi:hypothetical protein KGQ72_02730 [Patescibacteria group bacterium]|nr:hypothetical protein [Patescibacteria group bacterium]
MKGVNFYFAMLIVAIAAASATWLILHVVYGNNFNTTFGGSEANYAPLQQSILNQ